MFSPKDHRMPKWLPSALPGKGKGYSEITDTSGHDPFEMNDFETSDSRSKDPLKADTSYASLYPRKPLPEPPTRNQQLRRSARKSGRRVGHIFQRNEGYHFGLLCATCTIASVLIVNLVLTIWASSRYGVREGLGTIHAGKCDKTETMATWLHLAINALSTLLLGASDYAMQCLAAPTREEVDRANKSNHWMDIGVPSMRNLWRISRWRLFMWILVASSSIPLHLMYNSAVFSTLSAREYTIFTVTNDYLTGAAYNVSRAATMPSGSHNSYTLFGSMRDTYRPYRVEDETAQRLQSNSRRLDRLDNKACIEEYSREIMSTRSNLLLVTSHGNDTNSILAVWNSMSPGFDQTGVYRPPWVCDLKYDTFGAHERHPECNLGKIAATASTWTMGGHPIQYCLSEPVEEHCQLQFSVGIMVIVIICNAVKMAVMGYIAWAQPPNLVTIGDAMASFLDRPDPSTAGSCLAGLDHFKKSWQSTPIRWEPRARYWFQAASKKRWLICNILCFTALTVSAVLLSSGLKNNALATKSISHLWSLGLGRVTAESLVSLRVNSIVLTIIIANSPQLILSFLYLTYNGLFTCMLLADEWNDYAHHRKPVRVTSPVGGQRSTYRLQLPYKYGIPLIILSGLLHWLVSQSIFLARVAVYDDSGNEDETESISTCGYSCMAIIFTIILGTLVVLLGIANGFRKYRPGMPLVGSCSAAISASCHPPEADTFPSTNPIMWGAVECETNKDDADSAGHCSLTSIDFKTPQIGKLYAGLRHPKIT